MRFTHFAVLATLTVLSVPALAKTKADREVEQFAKEAEAKYRGGDFRGSAELLLKAYEVKPLSKLLYNAARAYDKAGDANEAMRFYQRYLDAADTEPDLVRKSARALDRLRASIPPPVPAATPPPPAPPPPAPEPAPAPPPPAPQTTIVTQPASTSTPVKPLVFVAGGLAVVSLGAGSYFAVVANKDATAFKASYDPTQKPAIRDRAQREALIADIGIGVGVVLAVATVVLFVTGRRAPVTVDPTAGAGVSWDF